MGGSREQGGHGRCLGNGELHPVWGEEDREPATPPCARKRGCASKTRGTDGRTDRARRSAPTDRTWDGLNATKVTVIPLRRSDAAAPQSVGGGSLAAGAATTQFPVLPSVLT